MRPCSRVELDVGFAGVAVMAFEMHFEYADVLAYKSSHSLQPTGRASIQARPHPHLSFSLLGCEVRGWPLTEFDSAEGHLGSNVDGEILVVVDMAVELAIADNAERVVVTQAVVVEPRVGDTDGGELVAFACSERRDAADGGVPPRGYTGRFRGEGEGHNFSVAEERRRLVVFSGLAAAGTGDAPPRGVADQDTSLAGPVIVVSIKLDVELVAKEQHVSAFHDWYVTEPESGTFQDEDAADVTVNDHAAR